MSDPAYCEYRERMLIVLPGLTWEEWQTMWNTIETQYKNVNWWVGDALVAGQREFGEQFAQVVDPKYIHQQTGPMWVSSRIPPAERREGLSWSAHRAAANCSPEERREIFDLAVANGWGAREVADEKRRRDDARRHNVGPVIADDLSTWKEPEAEDAPPEDAVERAAPVAQEAPEPSEGHETTPTPDIDALPFAEALRAALGQVRKLAPEIDDASSSAIADLSNQCRRLLEIPPGIQPLLLDPLTIVEHRPHGWHVAVADASDGNWSVEFHKGNQRGIGYLPHLGAAMLEALLSATLSDMGLE